MVVVGASVVVGVVLVVDGVVGVGAAVVVNSVVVVERVVGVGAAVVVNSLVVLDGVVVVGAEVTVEALVVVVVENVAVVVVDLQFALYGQSHTFKNSFKMFLDSYYVHTN